MKDKLWCSNNLYLKTIDCSNTKNDNDVECH